MQSIGIIPLPLTKPLLYGWIITLAALYVIVAYAVEFGRARHHANSGLHAMHRIFNSGVFAGGIVLLIAVIDPDVLAIIGDTSNYLIFAGFAAVVYPIIMLFA